MSTDYTQLITSEHADKPKFSALVQTLAGAFGDVADVVQSLPQAFDLDVALGAQLDVIGLWVGQPRDVANVPVATFFGFEDNVAAEVFGEHGLPQIGGRFYEEGEQFESTIVLADPEYRLMLKSKIVRNHADGNATDLMQALLYLFGFTKGNYLLWSEQFQQGSYWGIDGVTVTADVDTAPDGTVTADLITGQAGNSGSHGIIKTSPLATDGPVVFSIHAKYVNYQFLKIAVDDGGSSRVIVTFDIQAQTITRQQTAGQASQLQCGIIPAANGYLRLWVSGLIPPGPNKRVLALMPQTGVDGGYATWTTAGTEQVRLWGAQLEPGVAPGPYLRVGAINTAKIVDTNDKAVTIQLPEALVSLQQLAMLENLDLLPRTAGIDYTIQTI